MKRLFLIFALVLSAIVFPVGCQHQVTLEPGGAYSDATLATADQAILDASHTFTGFLDWYTANAAFLAKWPEVGQLASSVAAQKDGWIKNAYLARDAFAQAQKAYKDAKGSSTDVDTKRAQMNAALALISNVTQQITTYRNAHPHA